MKSGRLHLTALAMRMALSPAACGETVTAAGEAARLGRASDTGPGASQGEHETLLLAARRTGSEEDYAGARAAYAKRLPPHPSGDPYPRALIADLNSAKTLEAYDELRAPARRAMSAAQVQAFWDIAVLNLYTADGSLREFRDINAELGFLIFHDLVMMGHGDSVFALSRLIHPDPAGTSDTGTTTAAEQNIRLIAQHLNRTAANAGHAESTLALAAIPIAEAQQYFRMGGDWRPAAHSQLNQAKLLVERSIEQSGGRNRNAQAMQDQIEAIRSSNTVNWEVALPVLIGVLATLGTFSEGEATYEQGYTSNQRAVACSTLVYGDSAHQMAAAMAWGC